MSIANDTTQCLDASGEVGPGGKPAPCTRGFERREVGLASGYSLGLDIVGVFDVDLESAVGAAAGTAGWAACVGEGNLPGAGLVGGLASAEGGCCSSEPCQEDSREKHCARYSDSISTSWKGEISVRWVKSERIVFIVV